MPHLPRLVVRRRHEDRLGRVQADARDGHRVALEALLQAKAAGGRGRRPLIAAAAIIAAATVCPKVCARCRPRRRAPGAPRAAAAAVLAAAAAAAGAAAATAVGRLGARCSGEALLELVRLRDCLFSKDHCCHRHHQHRSGMGCCIFLHNEMHTAPPPPFNRTLAAMRSRASHASALSLTAAACLRRSSRIVGSYFA